MFCVKSRSACAFIFTRLRVNAVIAKTIKNNQRLDMIQLGVFELQFLKLVIFFENVEKNM